MLYFIYGTDTKKAGSKANEIIKSASKKNPEAEIFKINGENPDMAQIESLVKGQGLFSPKHIVLLNKILENAEIEKSVREFLSEMKKSESLFIILEAKVLADLKKRIEKYADKSEEFEAVKKEDPNNERVRFFALTDALGERNKKKLWLSVLKYYEAGEEAESLHGSIFWQIKNMLLARDAKSAKEAGLNDFVFRKAKAYSKNYPDKQLEVISSELICMYHDAHRGLIDFDVALEKFALKI